MTLGQAWQIILISNCMGGILLAVLYLFLKSKFDNEYVNKKHIPQKGCFDVFITKEMYNEKQLRVEGTIIGLRGDMQDLKADLNIKFNMLMDMYRGNHGDNK